MQLEASYAEAIGRKCPEQVVIAIAKDAQGKYNPISLGWTMITSSEPPMMAISVGLTRHSLSAIRQGGEFVIAFPSVAMESDMKFFGTKSGRDMDKIAARGTMTQPATKIDCVLLYDAVANFECKLEAELETGDHVILVGQIVAVHVNEDPTARRLFNFAGEGFGDAVLG